MEEYSARHYQAKCAKSEENCKKYAETLQNLLPNQENNAGKYLTTNGEVPSWQEVNLTNKANTDFSNIDSNIDYIIESYNDGTNWYRVYKSGWIEQGGANVSVGANTSKTINLLKPYKDTNSYVTFCQLVDGTTADSWNFNMSKTATTVRLINTQGSAHSLDWHARGQGV